MPVLDAVTLQRFHTVEQQFQNELLNRYLNAPTDATSAQGVVVRDLFPDADLESGDDNGWGGTSREWLQDLTGGSADAFNEVYTIDSNSGAEDKIIGILAFTFQDADPVTTSIQFLSGSTGNQGVRDEVAVDALPNYDYSTGLLSDAVIYGYNQDGTIEQYITATDTEHVLYRGYVAEAVGETISRPTNPGVGGGGANTTTAGGG